tara:strand:+ start:408 stop:629 length:222 start_codon:yes stop_codon:yes gene_type:complete
MRRAFAVGVGSGAIMAETLMDELEEMQQRATRLYNRYIISMEQKDLDNYLAFSAKEVIPRIEAMHRHMEKEVM